MTFTRVASVVAVALVGLLAFGVYAFAQSGRDAAPWERGDWPHAERGWGGWHDRGPDPERVRRFRAELAADLAAQLDTSADDVEAAFRAVVAERLQEAVEAGDIDQAQADQALAAYDDGEVRRLFHRLKS